jgi:integrase
MVQSGKEAFSVITERCCTMTKPNRARTPSYCRHKASGQAVVRIDGKDHYLGDYGTAESRAEYDRLISEWLGNGRRLAHPTAADGLTVAELILTYWRLAEAYYRNEHGQLSAELDNIRTALKPLRRLYGQTQASAFGPIALRAVQQDLIQAGLSRGVVNARLNRVRRVFKWAVSSELIPASVHQALCTVPGLHRGRCKAREAPPVQPAADEHANATLPFLPAPVRAMVELQRLTGCRPGEIMVMRAIDLTMTGPIWAYRPASHKNKHRGLDRVIFLGPQAQEIVRPFLTTNLDAYLFSPRAYVEAMHRRRAEERKTKRPPSQLARTRKAKPRRVPAERYNRRSYRAAVVRAADKATLEGAIALFKRLEEAGTVVLPEGMTFKALIHRKSRLSADCIAAIAAVNGLETELERVRVPRWSPLQLRHSAATAIRAKYGVEAAKVILGHTKVETTQIYAEADMGKAEKIMSEIG